tara:strand:+ start:338 stop:580 length:243 start_codon:yes stop_codon:yes gene_type:complete
MYLSETEEIIAFVVCIAIIVGFVLSTYLEIKNTIAEEKNKQKEKIENEEKIKTLIKYFDAKKNLIDRITETKKSLENRNK